MAVIHVAEGVVGEDPHGVGAVGEGRELVVPVAGGVGEGVVGGAIELGDDAAAGLVEGDVRPDRGRGVGRVGRAGDLDCRRGGVDCEVYGGGVAVAARVVGCYGDGVGAFCGGEGGVRCERDVRGSVEGVLPDRDRLVRGDVEGGVGAGVGRVGRAGDGDCRRGGVDGDGEVYGRSIAIAYCIVGCDGDVVGTHSGSESSVGYEGDIGSAVKRVPPSVDGLIGRDVEGYVGSGVGGVLGTGNCYGGWSRVDSTHLHIVEERRDPCGLSVATVAVVALGVLVCGRPSPGGMVLVPVVGGPRIILPRRGITS